MHFVYLTLPAGLPRRRAPLTPTGAAAKVAIPGTKAIGSIASTAIVKAAHPSARPPMVSGVLPHSASPHPSPRDRLETAHDNPVIAKSPEQACRLRAQRNDEIRQPPTNHPPDEHWFGLAHTVRLMAPRSGQSRSRQPAEAHPRAGPTLVTDVSRARAHHPSTTALTRIDSSSRLRALPPRPASGAGSEGSSR